MQKRVVITGIGAITPLGNFEQSWSRVLNGKPNITPVTEFDVSESHTKIASRITQPLDISVLPTGIARYFKKGRGNRASILATIATVNACRDAGIFDPEQKTLFEQYQHITGAVIGTGIGAPEEIASYDRKGSKERRRDISAVLRILPDSIDGNTAKALKLHGGIQCVTQACATGAGAVSNALDAIQLDRNMIMLAGGVDSFCELVHDAFANMKATTGRTEEPESASRPFDKNRDGFIMAEGACVLVLEEWEHAVKRGARMYAEVLGSASKSGCGEDTDPSTETQSLAMQEALRRAGIPHDQLVYINAHGTSTLVGDKSEIAAIRQTFKYPNGNCLVSSTKSTTGHLMGAAGALETAFTAMALYSSQIPPTINLDTIDPECTGVWHVQNTCRKQEITIALNNSFGFFDQCVTLVLGKIN